MSEILLFPEITILLFIQTILYILLVITLFYTIIILKKWDNSATSSYQYILEKKSYLVVTVIYFTLLIYILLLGFFLYTLNELASIIPGAMCGAGVIDINQYGSIALILKILVMLLISLWMVLNKEDQYAKNYPYFKIKMWFFVVIFIFITIEIIFQLLFLTNISTTSPVLCCSSIYHENSNRMIFNLSIVEIISLFYILSIYLIIVTYYKKRILLFIFSLIYTYISYYAITYFFSTYIYELPTHKCPFCMLQSDYNYIGYLIFTSLFMATFYAISASIFNFNANSFKKTIYWYIIFVTITSYPFILYLIKNNLFL